MTAHELDEKFDQGEDIAAHLDLDKAKRPGLEEKPEKVDLPGRNPQ